MPGHRVITGRAEHAAVRPTESGTFGHAIGMRTGRILTTTRHGHREEVRMSYGKALREETHVSYGKAVREELHIPTRELRHAIPDVYAGYKQLHDAALATGALDAKLKELIALAIAVSKECDGCIAAHAHAAVLHGAIPAEAAEAIGVAFLMNGGPATVYGARAYAAFCELFEEHASRQAG